MFIIWPSEVSLQPPPQALRFSHGRGERETRVTGDEPQGTMGRVQTAGEATSRPLSPSRLPLRAHFHRERERRLGTRKVSLHVWEMVFQAKKPDRTFLEPRLTS